MATIKVPAGVGIDLNAEGEGTSALGHRRALGALLKQASPGVPAPGRLGPDHFVVTGSPSAMEYRVSAGGLGIVRNPSNGVYLVGMPTAATVATDPSSGVNPRIDRIYALQPDPTFDGDDVDTELVLGVAVGAPAASPLLPALPSGAMELARKLVAAGATDTQSGAAFTNAAPVTGLNVPLTWESITGRPVVPAVILTGTVSITAGPGETKSAPVEFPPGVFTNPPLVFLTRRTGTPADSSTATNIPTAAGVTVYLANEARSTLTRVISWMAVQQ